MARRSKPTRDLGLWHVPAKWQDARCGKNLCDRYWLLSDGTEGPDAALVWEPQRGEQAWAVWGPSDAKARESGVTRDHDGAKLCDAALARMLS